jgi:MSHA pilin protein MshD
MVNKTSRHGRKNHKAACDRGFTLMEVMFAMMVLAFSVAALTQAVVSGQSHTYEAMHSSRAITLAEAMIDEVLSKPYDDPEGELTVGPDTGETSRDLFDNADDYDGLTEAVGAVQDQSLTAYPALYQKFGRSVTAGYTTENLVDLGGDHNGLAVTVTVTDQTGRAWTLSRFIQEPAS